MRGEQKPMAFLPVSLLIGGRPCLVVGGGTIAARKVGHLLAADADVTVIAPGLDETLVELAASGVFRHEPRAFDPEDVGGQFLVFAATDDEVTNAAVVDACKARGILCGAVDSNWPRGDVMMPAVMRKSGVTVSVSTGGRSCTQARDVKDRIAAVLEECVSDTQEGQ